MSLYNIYAIKKPNLGWVLKVPGRLTELYFVQLYVQ